MDKDRRIEGQTFEQWVERAKITDERLREVTDSYSKLLLGYTSITPEECELHYHLIPEGECTCSPKEQATATYADLKEISMGTWCKTSERLPEKVDDYYLVSDGTTVWREHFNTSRQFGTTEQDRDNAKFWMDLPLPPAPKSTQEYENDWLRRFVMCSGFGPPPDEIIRAHNILEKLIFAQTVLREFPGIRFEGDYNSWLFKRDRALKDE